MSNVERESSAPSRGPATRTSAAAYARESLEEFADRPGRVADLVTEADIVDIQPGTGRLRICRQITMDETETERTISYPRYERDLGDIVHYRDRYDKIPREIETLRRRIESPAPGWLEDDDSCTVEFEQREGCSSRQCGRCEGNTIIPCPKADCRGGRMRCTTCQGDERVSCPNGCRGGNVTCKNCSGSGSVDDRVCPNCNGDGDRSCDHCESGRIPCPDCNDGRETCSRCHGKTIVSCPRCSGSGKVVDVKAGTIDYTPSEWYQGDPEAMVPLDMLLGIPTDHVETTRKSTHPRYTPAAVESCAVYKRVPGAHVTYTYGDSEYEFYRIGDEYFHRSYPTTPRVKGATVLVFVASILGFLFIGLEMGGVLGV